MEFAILGNGRKFLIQDFPYLHNKVLTTGQLALHKINIEIDILVIKLIDHFCTNKCTQSLQINNKPCFRVGCTLHRNNQIKIMAMPVIIGTWAKNFNILLLRPYRVIQLMRCVEVFFTGDVEHIKIYKGSTKIFLSKKR